MTLHQKFVSQNGSVATSTEIALNECTVPSSTFTAPLSGTSCVEARELELAKPRQARQSATSGKIMPFTSLRCARQDQALLS
mmetsp:Transcript_111487/g.279191  ORF Transcript_111487/g.279191 Transcript_111487/m.279191 type:complete len:82 (+) Transcript_111487:1403-1648(+)